MHSFIVLSVRHTSSVVKRLSDGFTSLYSNNDLKRYNGGSPYFAELPPSVKNILVHKFTDLLADDLTEITRHDPLNIPDALQLLDLETGEPVDETGKEGQATDSQTGKIKPDDIALQKYIEQEGTLRDILDMQKENPPDPTQKLFKQADIGSDDSDDENDEEDLGWTGRLRPRKGKRVHFG